MSETAPGDLIPDHEGEAQYLPDYTPAEAEESRESGEGEV